MKDKTFLFAYGTLRNGFDAGVKSKIAAYLVLTGTGKVQGKLYDLGKYPGAVKTNEENEIEGDVFEVLKEEVTFRILDEYEGDEYERGRTGVLLDSGDEMKAWIYWYKKEPGENRLITEKDYRSYLKKQKTAYNRWSITK